MTLLQTQVNEKLYFMITDGGTIYFLINVCLVYMVNNRIYRGGLTPIVIQSIVREYTSATIDVYAIIEIYIVRFMTAKLRSRNSA